MSDPTGFASPEAALIQVATCLATFTIANSVLEDDQGNPMPDLAPDFFIADDGVGGTIDCCPKPIMRIESTGELPAAEQPAITSKGCLTLYTGIKITFRTCFQQFSKKGVPYQTIEQLQPYALVIMRSRWDALQLLRCCGRQSGLRPPFKFEAAEPRMDDDAKCCGWEIRLRAPVSLCGTCQAAEPVSS